MSDEKLARLGRFFLKSAMLGGFFTLGFAYECFLGCRLPGPIERAVNSVAEALHLPGIWDYSFIVVVFFWITAVLIGGALIVLVIETYRRLKKR